MQFSLIFKVLRGYYGDNKLYELPSTRHPNAEFILDRYLWVFLLFPVSFHHLFWISIVIPFIYYFLLEIYWKGAGWEISYPELRKEMMTRKSSGGWVLSSFMRTAPFCIFVAVQMLTVAAMTGKNKDIKRKKILSLFYF